MPQIRDSRPNGLVDAGIGHITLLDVFTRQLRQDAPAAHVVEERFDFDLTDVLVIAEDRELVTLFHAIVFPDGQHDQVDVAANGQDLRFHSLLGHAARAEDDFRDRDADECSAEKQSR